MYCFRSAIDSEKPLLHGIRNRDQRVKGFTRRDGCSLLELTHILFLIPEPPVVSELGHQYCFLSKKSEIYKRILSRHYWHISCAIKEEGEKGVTTNVRRT